MVPPFPRMDGAGGESREIVTSRRSSFRDSKRSASTRWSRSYLRYSGGPHWRPGGVDRGGGLQVFASVGFGALRRRHAPDKARRDRGPSFAHDGRYGQAAIDGEVVRPSVSGAVRASP